MAAQSKRSMQETRVSTRPGLGAGLDAPRPSLGCPRVVAHRYRLSRLLGEGGMGRVWAAEDLARSRSVAVKLMRPPEPGDVDAIGRVLREARIAALLETPHVVQVLDCGVDRGEPFIVMERLEGESLAARLEREGRLRPPEVARILLRVSRALGRAHELGVVHRDLKPDNVFLLAPGDETLVKVLDFGIASVRPGRFERLPREGRDGGLVGTPLYMSPEQAEQRPDQDHRADIWAFGVVAYECLLGHPPFVGDTLGRLIVSICVDELPVPSRYGDVPPGFDAWFARACARSRAERFDSVRHAARELCVVCAPAYDAVEPPLGARWARSTPACIA